MVEDLEKLTVVKLKEELKKLGLPVAGRKAELVARLQEALEADGGDTVEAAEEAEEVEAQEEEPVAEPEQAEDKSEAVAEKSTAQKAQPADITAPAELGQGDTTEDSDDAQEAAEPASAEPAAQEDAAVPAAAEPSAQGAGDAKPAEVTETQQTAEEDAAPARGASAEERSAEQPNNTGAMDVDSQAAERAPATEEHKSASNNERHAPDPIPEVEEEGVEGGPVPVDVVMAPVEEPVSATPVREERLPAMQAAMLAPQLAAGEPENMEAEEDVDFEADDAEDAEPSAAPPPQEPEAKVAKETGRKSARGERTETDAAAEPERKKGRLSEPSAEDGGPELARSDSKSGRKREPIPLFKPREQRERDRKANGETPLEARGPRTDSPALAPRPSLDKKPSIFDRLAGADGSTPRPSAPATRTKASRALLITGFIRPFTVQGVQKMLNTHGAVEKLWMPLIKDCAYVLFKSEQDAEAARQACHGLEWPVGSRTSLRPKFVPAEEAEEVIATNGEKLASKRSGASVTTEPGEKTTAAAQPSAAEKPKAVKGEPAAAEKSKRREDSKPSAKKEKAKEEEKVLSLDDLFKKTEAVPHLYWLPLTEKEIAAKASADKAKPSTHKA